MKTVGFRGIKILQVVSLYLHLFYYMLTFTLLINLFNMLKYGLLEKKIMQS